MTAAARDDSLFASGCIDKAQVECKTWGSQGMARLLQLRIVIAVRKKKKKQKGTETLFRLFFLKRRKSFHNNMDGLGGY